MLSCMIQLVQLATIASQQNPVFDQLNRFGSVVKAQNMEYAHVTCDVYTISVHFTRNRKRH